MTLSVTNHSFDSLKHAWNRILGQSAGGSIFSSWEFQAAWYATFGQGAQLCLLAANDGSETLGLAPLLQQDGRITFVGAEDVCDYLDFPIVSGREPAVLSAVLDFLAALVWDKVELISLRQGSPTLMYLPPLAEARGWRVELDVQDVCPVVALPQDWEAYLVSLSKKDRHELRRKLRRLEANATARCFLGCNLTTDMEAFIALHRQSNEDKAGFMDPRMEIFFHRLAAEFAPLGRYGMYLMEVDGQTVSAAMCFFTPEELLLYNSGFRRDYGHLSVGLLLKAHCIRDAIERRLPVFNFLRGREPYKYHLGGQDEPVYRLVLRRT